MSMFKRIIQGFCSFLLSFLIALIVLEVGWRTYYKEFNFTNFLQKELAAFKFSYQAEYDDKLGWIPKKGKYQFYGTRVTILEDGIRLNSKFQEKRDFKNPDKILVIGDSYAFGHDVSDHETWPAILEAMLSKKVINAGVFGYGIDQSFIRTNYLISKYHPETLIFSFIPDDINRCGTSKRSRAYKPYFEPKGNLFYLKNKPVPPPDAPMKLTGVRELLGHSLFLHRFMMQVVPAYWLPPRNPFITDQVHREAEKTACFLINKLESMAKFGGVKEIFLVILYSQDMAEDNLDMIDRLFPKCLGNSKVTVVDFKNILLEIKNKNPADYQKLYKRGHLSYEGNNLVAKILAKELLREDQ